jgi:regulator of replication initiation timing
MEGKIKEERQRHNSMITKMEEAVKLNSDLKEEYQNQLRIFQELKTRYEEKVTLLTMENAKLEEVLMSKSVPDTAQSNQQVINDNLVSEETSTQ